MRKVSSSPATRHLRDACVLVVEDDEEMRELLAGAMRYCGCRVAKAADGDDALEQLDECREGGAAPPDLVITDLHMPGKGGLEVIEQVQAWWPELPVIVITAFGDPQTHHDARQAGAVEVLDKPFDLRVLQRRVEELVTTSP